MTTIIIWFRSDLRMHDHPALAQAVQDGNKVVPVFIFNDQLLQGDHSGSNRSRFLLESLQDLKQSLQKVGGDLVVRNGDSTKELLKLAQETGANSVYYSADYSPYALHRDAETKKLLEKHDITMRGFGGRLAVNALDKIMTKAGTPHKVFTPFWRTWSDVGRRDIASKPDKLQLPKVTLGRLPALDSIVTKSDLSPEVLKGGETAGRKRLHAFLHDDIGRYKEENNYPGTDSTSRLSAYLHFGCVSAREIETLLPNNNGAASWHRQLAWRDFYHYVLYHFPDNAKHEFQEKYRNLSWSSSPKLLTVWQQGKTGYPMVDAAMRQLAQQGWMHNRARLVVGSFLVKDLDIDWRKGERYFMRMLIDGDMANNNGNWQWISSVGVDPAPMYRRLYNPASQAVNYDPDGVYIRHYVPELKDVPLKYLAEPWKMPDDVQQQAKCIIGKDYPKPVVDHKQARLAALEKYRAIS